MLDLTQINNDWTLFLDRDGVINHDKDNDYIRNWEEFRFYDTTLEAMALLAQRFARILIVTNQKGVGRQLMTLADLQGIHQHMQEEISKTGGRIDSIYFCSDLDNDSINRKPNPGMAFQAKADFPGIDFSKSIVVGNRTSDMEFGRNAGMYTVFVASTHPETPFPDPRIDMRFDNLLDFAIAMRG
jgi:D-glycero-D-manno-heptose 1,7-bisphosphate phosphatase